jgi:ComF family protein
VPDAAGCSRCRGFSSPFDRVGSFGIYDGDLRRLIHLLKYGKMLPLAGPLAARMLLELPRFGPVDLILPVPLHWTRQWRRGFNQSAVLGQHLAAGSGIGFRAGALRPIRRPAPQAGLSDSERLENMHGAFTASAGSLQGQRVLLVDDVLTTGATMAAAGAAVKAAGAAYVGALTLARAIRQSGVPSGPMGYR